MLLLFVMALRFVRHRLCHGFFPPSPNPILINGMIDAKQMMRIPQHPGVNGAIPIMRN